MNKSDTNNPGAPGNSEGDYKVTVDKANIIPYRKADGTVGWKAEPIEELTYEETVAIAMEYSHSIFLTEEEQEAKVAEQKATEFLNDHLQVIHIGDKKDA